ncbi:hypothetical protein [Rhizobium sp. Root1220]|uniref:hypothetical protein n=1 Tax=Rhizobium sp. Root1220 TaxID=1736432 RepID=UPI001FCD59BE|nr:hypothetical protein [Rhizobium sp. Root1220]
MPDIAYSQLIEECGSKLEVLVDDGALLSENDQPLAGLKEFGRVDFPPTPVLGSGMEAYFDALLILS